MSDCVLGYVQPFATLCIVAHQVPLSMGFPWQEYWSELPFPILRYLPDSGIELVAPVVAARFFTFWTIGEAHSHGQRLKEIKEVAQRYIASKK